MRGGMRGAAGRRPGKFSLRPLTPTPLPRGERGCPQCQAARFFASARSVHPVAREGRGALLDAKLHALLQARDLCIP
ncbi:protein of unknown function [Azospirillum lipoferum 4B]|uniref:Uncharacterized protein n=1 Tax=Azospirillum lipoferum (strain 4B) TaxID=862719 RepID=G7Z2T9_AZOL4|nr:protein of unknown function [Azospirillum lipoferum 4B]